MRSYRIMKALSAVDEELLARSEQDCGRGSGARYGGGGPRRLRGFLWRQGHGLAAALCLALVGGAGWATYQFTQDKGQADSASGGTRMNEQIWQETYSMEEAEDAAGEWEEFEGGADDGTGIAQDVENDGMNRADASDLAECPTSEAAGNDMEKQLDTQEKAKLLTLEEARSLEGRGDYIPAKLPEGYVFEEALYYADAPGGLTVIWSRGEERMVLDIREAGTEEAVVDADVPESYDMRLYQVPYEETVPGEYWVSFCNPVFASGDLSLDMVRGRMALQGEEGESDMPRGCFGVLYPDGALVSFDGFGTAEEIWEMFCTIGGDGR